jgi:hypothetical protein
MGKGAKHLLAAVRPELIEDRLWLPVCPEHSRRANGLSRLTSVFTRPLRGALQLCLRHHLLASVVTAKGADGVSAHGLAALWAGYQVHAQVMLMRTTHSLTGMRDFFLRLGTHCFLLSVSFARGTHTYPTFARFYWWSLVLCYQAYAPLRHDGGQVPALQQGNAPRSLSADFHQTSPETSPGERNKAALHDALFRPRPLRRKPPAALPARSACLRW